MNEENINNIEEKETNIPTQTRGNRNNIFLIVNSILFVGLVVLYVLFFTNKGGSCKSSATQTNPEAKKAVVGNLKVAYVNTDSIIVNYKYAQAMEKDIIALKNRLEKDYTNKVMSFKSDYENYLKIGATLTLSEQKKREESLQKREKELGQLQEKMMMQIQQQQISENIKLLNAVYAFIRDYNANNQKFNIILKKSFSESPILYADDALDITTEILEGLNKEYEEVKGVK